jgi:hypothetical protein
MGIKPAALFPLRSADCLACLSALLPQNISIFTLRETGSVEPFVCGSAPQGRFLVLLYEKTMLEKTMSDSAARLLLSDLGYPAAVSLFPVLHYLKTRFSGGDFPHEVGLFLGYPPEDVTGFIRHKGQNYKFCGYWKVYGDVEQAKRLFRRYDLCRKCMEWYMNESPRPAI